MELLMAFEGVTVESAAFVMGVPAYKVFLAGVAAIRPHFCVCALVPVEMLLLVADAGTEATLLLHCASPLGLCECEGEVFCVLNLIDRLLDSRVVMCGRARLLNSDFFWTPGPTMWRISLLGFIVGYRCPVRRLPRHPTGGYPTRDLR
jgi:hypothetical protein